MSSSTTDEQSVPESQSLPDHATTDEIKFMDYVVYTWENAHETFIHPPGNRTPCNNPPETGSSSMGLFDMLPVELQHLVLESFDLGSLETFKSLNSSCNFLIKTLPAYRDIRKYAPDILQVLTGTRMLSRYTVPQLFEAVCTYRCVACNGYGAFIFLPARWRCCYPCLETHPDLQVITTSQAKVCYGLTRKQLSKIPVLWTIPSTITSDLLTFEKSVPLVSIRLARDLGIAAHGSLDAMQRFIDSKYSKNQWRHRKGKKSSSYVSDPYWKAPHHQNDFDPLFQGLAFTGLPFFNPKTRHVQPGYYCRGCEIAWSGRVPTRFDMDTARTRMNTVYSEDDFTEHYKICEEAQYLWAQHLVGKHWWDKYENY